MEDNQQTPARRKKWMTPVLIISLGLNLLVVGAGAGLLFYWPRHHFTEGSRYFGAAGLGALSGALGDEDKRIIGDEIRDKRPRFGQLRAEASENVSDLIGILRAEPFDPAELESHFQRQRDGATRMLVEGHDLLALRIIAMTATERQGFADRLERRFKTRGMHLR